MKVLHFLLAALFLYIAYLQLNDPDPLYWICIYVGTATVALSTALGRRDEFWTAILIGATAAGMIIAAPSLVEFLAAGNMAEISDMAAAPYVEPAREFGGLLFAFGVLLYYYLKRKTPP